MDYQEDIISFQDFKRIIQSNGSANWIRKLKRSFAICSFHNQMFPRIPTAGPSLGFYLSVDMFDEERGRSIPGTCSKRASCSFVLFTFCVFDS